MIKYENRDNGRFYYLYISKDLLNDYVLNIVRGGRNVSVHRSRGFACPQTLNEEIRRICKIREKRGYRLVEQINALE